MFQIKICGITTPRDAEAAVAAGADAIGLVFFAKSPRAVTPQQAADVVSALAAPAALAAPTAPPGPVVKVGLFVNESAQRLLELRDALGLDLLQLHGDEPPEYVAELGGAPVMRAFRPTSASLGDVFAYLDRCAQLGCTPHRVLLDAYRPDQYGGTGELGDWDIARRYLAEAGRPSLVLAGGLTPDNVAGAIAAVRPAAVDCSSGVESSPGVKDAAKIARFVAAARAAFVLECGD